ncbi:hypothetical protein NHX12_017277, partial [Muraenolepis orangiensis]
PLWLTSDNRQAVCRCITMMVLVPSRPPLGSSKDPGSTAQPTTTGRGESGRATGAVRSLRRKG